MLLFNTEITVNNIKYVNSKGLPGKTPEAPSIPKIEIKHHKEVLIKPILPVFILLVLITCYIRVRHYRRRKSLNLIRKSLEEVIKKTEDGLHLKEG